MRAAESREVPAPAVRKPQTDGWHPGLDGVRGISVFLVFTIHYVPRLLGYIGWTGVIIFFVLSGFLITPDCTTTATRRIVSETSISGARCAFFRWFYFIWLCSRMSAFFFRCDGGRCWRCGRPI
jgi:peptidoglycan/LPS O-acetylase OafA/YrhL